MLLGRAVVAKVGMTLGVCAITVGAALVWSIGVALLVVGGLLIALALLIGWE